MTTKDVVTVQLTREECRDLYICISMRKCFIETGDPIISAADAVKMDQQHLINALTVDQMKLMIRLTELQARLMR